MGRFGRLRLMRAIFVCVLVAAGPPAAAATRPHVALRRFRPRIGAALGLMPIHGQHSAPSAVTIPLVYHGGTVMHGVTVHALYWAPAGYTFNGAPSEGTHDYASVINGFLADVATDSGQTSNVFSLLAQYPDRFGSAGYDIHFDPAADVIRDTSPYPANDQGCISASGTATCVTDAALQAEIARVIATQAPTATGLHDVWMILLPPNVDTCLSPGSCATNTYAGYHSVFETAHGPVIYAAIPDPTIELVPPAGSDPQGNPEAESTLDTVAHELAEAMTDPEGAGWMDPNGFEVGDRCESGPQYGALLGYAPDGAPYNQLIAGHQYLIQAMWSNRDSGCLDRSGAVTPPVQLPSLILTQYSSTMTGRDPSGRSGRLVQVLLLRAGAPVAEGRVRTGVDGHFRLTLTGLGGRSVAVGDDREEVLAQIDGRSLLIQTGDGGNPFAASGWTGWFDLDHGFAVGRDAVALAPCSQTGVLVLRQAGQSIGAPLDQCSTSTDVADIPTGPLTRATRLTLDSEDNRASTFAYPPGALVTLRVALGEPGAVPAVANPAIPLETTGLPACTADLYAGRARCTGLVPDAVYRLVGNRRAAAARADANGGASFPASLGPLRGGDRLALLGSGGRRLTVLHIAHLRVDLRADAATATDGSCEPGEFVGPPVSAPPTGAFIGTPGVAGTGMICPQSGKAAGLPVSDLEQADDLSGGITRTEVPSILGTVPAQDATLYGPFRALVQAGGTGRDPVRLRITRAGSRRIVFAAGNVDTAAGVPVPPLARGSYTAVWVLRDRNGDTRTLRTLFVEA